MQDQSDAPLPDYKQRLRIGRFEVDPGALSVRAEGEPVRLKPKAMAVLIELARQPGVTLGRDELLDRVWKSTYITPGVVGHAITALRRAFGDSLEAPEYIETIPRIGYRLVAPVVSLDEPGAAAADNDAAHTQGDAALAEPAAAAAASDAAASAANAEHAPRTGTRPASAPRPRGRHWRAALIVLALALALPLLLLAAQWLPGQLHRPPPPQRIAEQHRITFEPGAETEARVNAGGDWLVYNRGQGVGKRADLVLQAVHGTKYRVLAAGEGAQRPAWSADGRRIAYVWQDAGRCELRMLGIDDGKRDRIVDCAPDSLIYFDWNPTSPDTIAYSSIPQGQPGGSRIQLLVDEGGWRPRALDYANERDYLDLEPRFSPDGRRIAFRRGGNPTSDLYVMDVDGRALTRLTEVRARIVGFDWLPDGSGLVFSSDHDGQQALYVVDARSRRIQALGIDDATLPDVANRTWSLVYQIEGWRSALAEATLQGDASPHVPLSASSGRDRAASLSPDDRHLAFVSDRDGTEQLWLLERASGALRRLTQHANLSVDAPKWSPDGRRILYLTRAQGRHDLWELHVDSGSTRRLAAGRPSLRNAVYASDGISIWYIGWHRDAWHLHRCERRDAGETCIGRPVAALAWRVDAARVAGKAMLLLSSPLRSGEFTLVDEHTLAVVRRLRLPANEGWSVVDDTLWYFRGGDAQDASASRVLMTLSLRDGRTRKLAEFPGLRLLRYSQPLVTRDRKHLIVPTILDDSTDIGYARLAPPPEAND